MTTALIRARRSPAPRGALALLWLLATTPAFAIDDDDDRPLAQAKDERVQIAYRVAKQLGHARVYGIDEQSEAIDYFPFDALSAFAKRAGREAELAGPMTTGKDYVANLEKMQRKGTVADLLLWLNEPTDIDRQHRASGTSTCCASARARSSPART